MIKNFFTIASRFIEEKKFSGIIVSLIFFILVLLFCYTDIYELFELKLYDVRFKMKPSIQEWDRLSFLDIDENSLTIEGQYPWPRNLYAKGLKTLERIKAAQTGFDMMFLDSSPKTIDDALFEPLMEKIKKGNRIALADFESSGLNKDKIFADSIASMNRVILSYTFNDEPLNYDVLNRQKKETFKKALKRFLERSTVKLSPQQLAKLKSLDDPNTKSISYPIPEFMKSARSFGFVNRYTDIDGTVRKVQLVKVFQGRLYFNLALMMLMDVCRLPLDRVEVIPDNKIILRKAINPLTQAVTDITIPIDKKGMMYVTWAGSGRGKGGRREETFHLVPFYAIIEYNEKKDFVKTLFDQEDAIKKEEINGLNEQLASFTEELKNADADMKKNLVASIAELKKKIDAANYYQPLTELENKLEKNRNRYEKEKDIMNYGALWKEMSVLKKKIKRTKIEYLRKYASEIAQVKKELKRISSNENIEDLKKLQYAYTAMELVIRVEDLADRITLVGLTASGTQDIGAIPLHNEYARVGTYHNTINTVIQKQFITRVDNYINFICMFFTAIIMGYVIQRLNARRSLITIVATFIVLNIIIISLFAFFNIWVQQLGLSLSMVLPSLAIASIKFMKEENQKRFIKSAFSFYLSPSVIDTIIKDPESLELGGEDREITIFFSDVKSFSTISEKLSPQDLVKRLNEYLTEMTDIILKYNGTVDKYIGDAIMAFYGAPISMPDHSLKACMAAIDMKKRLRELQEQWRNAGLEEIHARMGIHSGNATVGNMGSRTRMDYTAMGDAVNLASRLEGANKFYETNTMISGSTYEGAKDYIDARELDVIRVIGKTQAVSIYELMGTKGSLPDRIYEMLEKYNQGRVYFIKKDWKQARQLFKNALKIVSDDGPSRVYVERCENFMKSPPSRGWDGVYALKTK